MNHSTIQSLVSMQNLQQKLDVIANNMANVGTNGYKRQEATFHDILTSTMRQPEAFQQEGRLTPPGLPLHWGAKLGAIQTIMAQGSLKQTDVPSDVAIEGNGLFEIQVAAQDENGQAVGQTMWTRDGSFKLTPIEGEPNVYLTTHDGHLVLNTDNEPIRFPAQSRIEIREDGSLFAYSNVNDDPPQALGKLKLVQVVRPQYLVQLDGNVFGLPDGIDPAAGDVLRNVTPGEQSGVAVRQGFLEQSNVNLADEMTELMLAQRAFQLSAKALTSSDNMMYLANSLRG